MPLPAIMVFTVSTVSHKAAAKSVVRTASDLRLTGTKAEILAPVYYGDERVLESWKACGHASFLPSLISPFESYETVCAFALTELPSRLLSHWRATHFLGVQWDGFSVNPSHWTDEFLEWDFVGAPWPDGVVGNNGFCLTTRKYWEAVRDLGLPATAAACHPCDARLARSEFRDMECYRDRLDAAGVRFAPERLARKFSVENEEYVGASFGLHGVQSLVSAFRQGLV